MIFLQLFTFFLLASIIFYLIGYFLKRQRLYKLAKDLQGKKLSISKVFRLFAFSNNKNVVNEFKKIFQNDPKLIKTWIFGYFVIITQNADLINKILNSQQTHDKFNDVHEKSLLSNSVINLSGDKHKRHRKIFNKAFTTKMLQLLPDTFDAKSKIILAQIERNVNCGEFDVHDYIGAYVLDSFSQRHLNYDYSHLQKELFWAYKKSSEIYFKIFPYLVFDMTKKILRFTKHGRLLEKCLKIMRDYKNAVIQNNENNPGLEENSVISLLLNHKNEFSDMEIFDEMFLFSFAAYDTTSSTISTVLMMLGIYQHIQQKTFEEINEICGNTENLTFSMDFINKFPYLDAVIKEAMRLFTVVPFIMRQASKDVDLDGCLIPKDTLLIIFFDGMHKNEKYWGVDALKFNPERFMRELRNPRAFAPFSDGRRICIGYRYAMISMKIFLINFIRSFHVDCSSKIENLETEIKFTQCFVNGYKIGVQKRVNS